MASAERTLVKSPPELWEHVDDPELMRRWTAELTGAGEAARVEVMERSPARRLVWRAAGRGESTAVELVLAEKGWGTNVSIRAGDGARGEQTETVLEQLLDELSSPQRRPFSRS